MRSLESAARVRNLKPYGIFHQRIEERNWSTGQEFARRSYTAEAARGNSAEAITSSAWAR
jgi:hypothetical protein